MQTEEKPKAELVDIIGGFFYDPLGFIYFAYPWGEKGTLLENEEGPDDWHIELLTEVSRKIKASEINSLPEALQIAIASGHTIGKTALVAWLIHWFMSTRPHPQITVTSNTETQLNTKTWRELAKWHNLAINHDWFTWTATRFYHNSHPETWFAAAIPWNKNKPEAFQGSHEKYILFIFDEASATPDVIWESAEGSINTPGAMWFVFGNPTRNTGRFRECFGKFKHRWLTKQIDSRNSKRADKAKIQEWIDDYGEDSDFVRIRVKGVFPRAGSNQFIDSETVALCHKYKAEGFESFPKIMTVDVARFGDDQTVMRMRQGRKVFPAKKHRNLDTMQTAARVKEMYDIEKPDYLMVDGVGVGGGVVDRLRQLNVNVIDVNAGATPLDGNKYFNKRAEMWGLMRDFLKAGAELPEDAELDEELQAIEYGFTAKLQIQLEKKETMKLRGLASPDNADGLALSFAEGLNLAKGNQSSPPPPPQIPRSARGLR
jgi:hypothetical protein